jgi:polyvinyl alcohol dehydrogenase (cytochrome)
MLSALSYGQDWPMAGQNTSDTRNQSSESVIGTSNVSQLVVKWSFSTGGGVESTPAVVNGSVYFPDRAGNFYALNAATGALIWSHSVSDWTGQTGDRSRGGPAVAGNTLFIGDQGGHLATYSNGVLSGPGARLLAIDTTTGTLLWSTQVESFPTAIITQAPVVYNGIVYIGVSGGEEDFPLNYPSYPCCSFRGSVVAVKVSNGQILWKTYDMPTTPSNPGGYSGGAIWGSTPVVDPGNGSLYVGTGNNYTVPADVETCIETAQSMGQPDSVCNSVDNYAQDYFDSIIALDLNTGVIKWGTRADPYDTWNSGCQLMLGECPTVKGPDADFAAGPNLLRTFINGNPVKLVGEGQKNGIYRALDPVTGKITWKTKVGPGSGGRQWGTATDGQRVYVPFPDKQHKTYQLQPSGATCNGGSWTALDVGTGSFLWQTATLGICTNSKNGTTGGCETEGPLSVANGVVYAGEIDKKRGDPTMFALDAATGQILWSFASGTVVHAGPAIASGVVYWGSGYSPTIKGKMYAFALPGS